MSVLARHEEETVGGFDGLAAVVTGGASGIGEATVRLLRQRGARVASLDLAAPVDAGGRSADRAEPSIRCDVTDRASVDAAIEQVVETFGRLDVVCSNAGVGAIGHVGEHEDEEWLRVLDVNVVGMARVARAALPYLVASPSAAIVNTGSVAAQVGLPQRALYSASKGAVHALTLAMAADHVGQGIRVNAVVPGTADTPWVERLLDAAPDPVAARSALRRRQPMGRLITPDEVANAIVYLAGPTSGSTTGTLLTVDGGLTGLRLPD